MGFRFGDEGGELAGCSTRDDFEEGHVESFWGLEPEIRLVEGGQEGLYFEEEWEYGRRGTNPKAERVSRVAVFLSGS
jgi:hypothetical protein